MKTCETNCSVLELFLYCSRFVRNCVSIFIKMCKSLQSLMVGNPNANERVFHLALQSVKSSDRTIILDRALRPCKRKGLSMYR